MAGVMAALTAAGVTVASVMPVSAGQFQAASPASQVQRASPRYAQRPPARLPTVESSLLDMEYSYVGNADWFSISGNEAGSAVLLNFTDRWLWRDGPDVRRNHVVYPLERINDIEFRATLNPPTSSNGELIYRVFGGNRLIYTSPILTNSSSPVRVELDVRPHTSLRIELEMRHTGGWNTIFHFDDSYLGIEDAVIISVEL